MEEMLYLSCGAESESVYLILLCGNFLLPCVRRKPAAAGIRGVDWKCAVGKRGHHELTEMMVNCAKCLNMTGHILHIKEEQLFEKHWTIERMCDILALSDRTNVLL